ncbi:MAG: tetratricopeptide repeat protein [Candidatus Thorarchaeota archaeon]
MDLRDLSIAVQTKPKWMAGWYITNSTLAGLTLILLSRLGYVQFDDLTAFLLGFFVPLGVYGIKHLMGLYRYGQRWGLYQGTEVLLQKAEGYFAHARYSEAIDVLINVLEYLPGHKRALFYVAKCYEKLGRIKDASDYYSEYLLLEPDDAEARAMLDELLQPHNENQFKGSLTI